MFQNCPFIIFPLFSMECMLLSVGILVLSSLREPGHIPTYQVHIIIIVPNRLLFKI